jgi:ABC-type glycerol-3-phosphate transport system substrate-binding protein
VTKAAAGTDFFQKDELRRLLVTQQETALRYGGPAYGNAPFLGEAEGKLLFSQALTDVVAGKKSAAEAVKTLDTELKEIAKTAPT